MKSDIDVVNSLLMFSTEKDVSENMLATLVRFVCAIYSPKGICINTIPEMRWYLFCKHMAESDKLPPTYRALRHMSFELMFKQEYRDNPLLLIRIYNWICYIMATIWNLMAD